MPETSTQTETRDTHRSIYTQCNDTNKVTVAVIPEHREMKTLTARPRFISKQKNKAPRKPGMRVSEVNTVRVKKNTHGKCVGTRDHVIKVEEEITVLRVINHIIIKDALSKQVESVKPTRKGTWKEGRPRRQELLYADVLENKENSAIKNRRSVTLDKESRIKRQQKRYASAEKRKKIQRENEGWSEKFREWSPTQQWPITKQWRRKEIME